jgi:EAL domain-containing protein (putative c-di-GMP-specific phosphodiesterase class I)
MPTRHGGSFWKNAKTYRRFNCRRMAEGVETEAQHAFLVQEGCDEVQGYLTGRPMPIVNYATLVGRRAVTEQNYAVAG